MEFSEFERQLEKLLIEEGAFSYFGSELSKLEYKEISNEIAIQDNLLGFGNSAIIEPVIDYAISCLVKSIQWNTKIRYFLFLIKNLESKRKYDCAKSFVDYFLGSPDKLLEMNNRLITECFNTLLEVCVRMKLRTEEIWDITLEHLNRNPQCIYYHVTQIMALITNGEKAEIIKSILLEQLLVDAKMGNYHPIEGLLDDANKFKKFLVERIFIQRKLAEAYMNQIENDNSVIRGMSFSQKAASIYKDLGDREEENKCLAILNRNLDSDSPEWQEVEVELPAEQNAEFNEDISLIKQFFSDTNIILQARIGSLAQFISTTKDSKKVTIYTPSALNSTIESLADIFNSSVIMQIVSVVTIDQNKVIANGNNSLLKARELAYSMHKESDILPALTALENSLDYSIGEIKNFIQECPMVTEDEMKFISDALDDYSRKRWIPFICVITPGFESILRELYRILEGTDIQAKNKDSLVHTTVNLTTILNNPKVREILSDDLANYLEYLLNSETSSENIRNNVAHRIAPSVFYSQDRSRVLIHALIQVTTRIKNKLNDSAE
jgi:hypothetical protein